LHREDMGELTVINKATDQDAELPPIKGNKA
jgi:hypothetical protein